MLHAGVGDQDVDATEGSDELLEHPQHVLFLRDIRLQAHGCAAVLSDLCDHRLGRLGIPVVVDADRRAGFGEGVGDGGANARACAGHNGVLAFEHWHNGDQGKRDSSGTKLRTRPPNSRGFMKFAATVLSSSPQVG